MTPGIFTDWICGGLNYQIEHHLFPSIPRHNLYTVSHLVKRFCKDHDLPYLCSDFNEGLQKVLAYLDTEIGRAVQQECRDRSRMPSSA
eukprot:TRINITY_DN745_c0_g1_i10.p1 TRINITY_DN745_c0_g1~~TRINITY_DN745_c0_g1_i10.p1  ORF type:complete len:102 (+),score=7.04 TRINITY_DN745_c0_g1_i10:43-306(+)